MSVPDNITATNFSGVFALDRSNSDPNDAMLKIQGVGWVTRKAISIASVSLVFNSHIEHDAAGKPVTNVKLDQNATGGISQAETRICDWEERDFSDLIFGKQVGRFRIIGGIKESDGKTMPDIEVQTEIKGDNDGTEKVKKFLRGEILQDGSPSEGWEVVNGNIEGFDKGNGAWLQSWVKSKKNEWTVEQLWGFELIEGKRTWSRRYVAAKGREYALCRMINVYQHA